MITVLSVFAVSQTGRAQESLDTALRSHSDSLDNAMDVCTRMSQQHLRSRCRTTVASASFFVQEAVDVCKGISSELSQSACIAVIANVPFRAIEAKSCEIEQGDRLKSKCLQGLKESINFVLDSNSTQVMSPDVIRNQISSAIQLMDVGLIFRARQVLGVLYSQLDPMAGAPVRPGRPLRRRNF